MSAEPPAIQDAPAPFSGAPDPEDTNPAPDFILRSSDGVDFHVHKQILAFVSVFFANMFKFPSGETGPTEIVRDGKDVVVFPEPQAVLFRLLSVAYPARSREHYSLTPADLDSVCAVHEAAQKYQFVHAQSVLTEMLLDPSLLAGQPHRLFAIAVLRNIPQLAREAALHTLNQPLCPQNLAFPEMAQLTWQTVQKLFDFHHRCGKAAQRLVEDTSGPIGDVGPHQSPRLAVMNLSTSPHIHFSWWEEQWHTGKACIPVYDPGEPWGNYNTRAPDWFRDHMNRVAERVRLVPCSSTLQAEAPKLLPADVALLKACDICDGMEPELVQFAIQLGPYIEESNRGIANVTFSS
ncbi:hypothetical protein DFH06DRAFT_1044293 [Mycena polygramma]|nr:hypothetical protein DFH06DRAFT_1044293 [Mycena polygramma]